VHNWTAEDQNQSLGLRWSQTEPGTMLPQGGNGMDHDMGPWGEKGVYMITREEGVE
jgi:hypothetical protein